MSVELGHIRELLLPGLWEISNSYRDIKEQWGAQIFVRTVTAPHIWIPKLTLPEGVALGIAAAIIKNPVVTRRFWSGWSL